MFRTYYTILFMLFLACSNPELSNCVITLEDCSDLELRVFAREDNGEEVAAAECECITITSDWSFDLGDGQYLVNSPGLTEMALTGSHRLLGQELNGTTGRRIPNGLNDTYEDNPHEGYASQRVYGNYIVAMYHPRRWAPDHFITYNWKSGAWIRWDLSEGPGIVNQSE